MGRLEQPRQGKNLLYRHDKPKETTKVGPLSFLLFESPFTSVSTVSKAHPSLVSSHSLRIIQNNYLPLWCRNTVALSLASLASTRTQRILLGCKKNLMTQHFLLGKSYLSAKRSLDSLPGARWREWRYFRLGLVWQSVVSAPADVVVTVAKVVDPDPTFSKKVESGFGGSE